MKPARRSRCAAVTVAATGVIAVTALDASPGEVGLLATLSTIAFLDRTNISIAGVGLGQEYGLTKVQLGWVFSAFLVGQQAARLMGDNKPNANGGGKVNNTSLSGSDIRENTFHRVPLAQSAHLLDGRTATSFQTRVNGLCGDRRAIQSIVKQVSAAARKR